MKRFKVYTKEKGIVKTNFIDDTIRNLTWHREDGPSFIGYYDNGNIAYEVYHVHNECHRLGGPADIVYDDNGNIEYEYYYIKGTKYTKEQYEKELLKLKVQYL